MTAMNCVQASGWSESMSPRNFPVSVRWAVELIGRNSVMPWMMPSSAAVRGFTGTSLYQECDRSMEPIRRRFSIAPTTSEEGFHEHLGHDDLGNHGNRVDHGVPDVRCVGTGTFGGKCQACGLCLDTGHQPHRRGEREPKCARANADHKQRDQN